MGIAKSKPAVQGAVAAPYVSGAEADKAKIRILEKKVAYLEDRISEVCTLKIIWGYSIIGLAGPPADRVDQVGKYF